MAKKVNKKSSGGSTGRAKPLTPKAGATSSLMVSSGLAAGYSDVDMYLLSSTIETKKGGLFALL